MIEIIVFLAVISWLFGSSQPQQPKAVSELLPCPPAADSKELARNIEAALKSLGFKTMEARRMVSATLKANPGIRDEEKLLKLTLKGEKS